MSLRDGAALRRSPLTGGGAGAHGREHGMKGEGSSGATPRSAVQGLGAPDLDRFLVALQWIAFAFIGLLAVAGAIRNSLAMGAGALAVLLVLLTAAGARVLARHGRRTLATTLVAAAILVHAVVQAYWLPFGAPALIVSIVLAVAAVLPHFGDRALRRFAIAAVLGSAAVVLVARVSPHIEDVPSELQTAIVFLAVPAVTWLAVILLRQWKERIRGRRRPGAARGRPNGRAAPLG